MTVVGRPILLTAIEYRTLAELSVNAGRVLTYEHLLRRVWVSTPTPTFARCAPPRSSTAASWAPTPTTPPTSSTSPASATGLRRVMRRDKRRRDLQGLHWQCRVCRTLALWGAPSETAVTVLSSRGRSSNNRGSNALAPASGVWRGRPR